MTTAWSYLPNAVHIDRVLADVRANFDKWVAAWETVWFVLGYDVRDDARDDVRRTARNAARDDASRDATRTAAWSAAKSAARDAAWSAAKSAARAAVRAAAWSAASDAIFALIAYDDCAHLLDGNPDDVKLMALLGSPTAVLLYPACVALNKQMEIA